MVGGSAVGIVLIVQTVSAFSDIERFTAPGAVTLDLEPAENQTVYVQTGGSRSGVGSLDCTVTGADGTPVAVASSFGLTLTIGSEEYASQAVFSPPRADAYELSCDTAGGPLPAAVGPELGFGGLFARIGGTIAAFGLSFVLALAIFFVTLIRRTSHKRRLQAGA